MSATVKNATTKTAPKKTAAKPEDKKETVSSTPEKEIPTPENATSEKEAPVTAAPQPDISAPTKRGRGRPRKDGGPAAPVSPSEAAAASASKAGRKPKIKPAKMDSNALAKQVQGLHQLAALATGIPEFQLHDAEALMLGDAIANVCEEYDLSLSGKTGAFLQLIAAAAMVYVPRVEIIGRRVKEKKAQQRANTEALRVVAGNEMHGSETSHA